MIDYYFGPFSKFQKHVKRLSNKRRFKSHISKPQHGILAFKGPKKTITCQRVTDEILNKKLIDSKFHHSRFDITDRKKKTKFSIKVNIF